MVIPYVIPTLLLTDNVPQFVIKIFASIYTYLGVSYLTTTAYHPHTNGQVERFNETIATCLRLYVGEHQREWDMFAQPPTYAYNTQNLRSTNTSLFSLVLRCDPPGPIMLSEMRALHTDVSRETTVQATLLALQERIEALRARTDGNPRASEQRWRRHLNIFERTVPTLAPGDMVLVDRPPLSETATTSAHAVASTTYNKLLYRALGPF